MKIAYFDCFSGAAGDMILAAMISAGLDPEQLRADLARLKLGAFDLEIREVRKQGFAAVAVEVRAPGDQGHRHLRHITDIIDAADLPEAVKDTAKRIFTRLAEAEAKVHGTSLEKVHFHEVGAIDSIVDIVGAAIGLHRLATGGWESSAGADSARRSDTLTPALSLQGRGSRGGDAGSNEMGAGRCRVVCSPIPTGSGTITCQHGVLPVPAPATAELLRGVPLAECDEVGELTTPTGAAILTTLAESFGPVPPMRIARIGYGAGTREGRQRPNLLRLLVGESAEEGAEIDQIVLLETQLDDATGEEIGHARERLFAAGAVDVFTTPIQMKKGRPGVLLTVLSPPEAAAACEEVLFRETTTFGVRRHFCHRSKLRRRVERIGTRFGEIRVKLGLRGDEVVQVSPEYDDCSAAALRHGAALRQVMDEARLAWMSQHKARTLDSAND